MSAIDCRICGNRFDDVVTYEEHLPCAKYWSQRSRLTNRLLEFHHAFEQPIRMVPSVPDERRVRLRGALIAEEAFEVLLAMFGNTDSVMTDAYKATKEAMVCQDVKVDLPDLADGLADLDYVVEGTRLEFGIDGEPIAAEVHRANMTKIGGPKDPETGKQLKPAGWRPPDIEGCLRNQGWKP